MSKNTQYTLCPHFGWEGCDSFDIFLNGKKMLNITRLSEAQSIVDLLNNSVQKPIDASSVEEIPLVKELQERIDITDSPKLKSLLERSLAEMVRLKNHSEMLLNQIYIP